MLHTSQTNEATARATAKSPLNRVIALKWIGEWQPDADDSAAAEVREAILDERWSDAVVGWMTGSSRTRV